ncbi:aspartyl/asparaginyl beta-hydroxylase-like isoform X3 [Lates japonicus]|uniref:Aspartyl/asparaginyl beta-hydroxylase-like isoform X3 n=1 Tax=Lates japonicus TaxID=270547 RepID=A0AAD3M201_LATJO|nr:aspartyl/asparaginyl beta-hydroxylase-like isoform X3 [Lates japonicus]
MYCCHVADGTKTQSANKNGKKADSGSSSSFFTWFIVLALLGVWTSVAVVYFDLVDYQGVLDKAKGLQINLSEALQGKLVAYDTDGDGDFDVEDAKVLLGKLIYL